MGARGVSTATAPTKLTPALVDNLVPVAERELFETAEPLVGSWPELVGTSSKYWVAPEFGLNCRIARSIPAFVSTGIQRFPSEVVVIVNAGDQSLNGERISTEPVEGFR